MLERLERQGSFRAVSNQSPFKRQMSLRLSDLPSNAERQKSFLDPQQQQKMRSVSPIPEVSPHKPSDTVAQLCAELSQGLSLLTTRNVLDADASDDLNFNNMMSVNQNTAATVSLIHSPISPPVVSVFPPLSATLGQMGHMQATTPPTAQVMPSSRYNSAASGSSPDTPTNAAVSPADLPGPAEWLAGQIVQSGGTSPVTGGRRAPALATNSRTRSLQMSAVQSPSSSGPDPFDAEWVAGVARLGEAVAAPQQTPPTSAVASHHTNPFISPPKPPAQSFQVQL